MVEINSESEFVAKNNDFINFAEELSKLTLNNSGKMDDIITVSYTHLTLPTKA